MMRRFLFCRLGYEGGPKGWIRVWRYSTMWEPPSCYKPCATPPSAAGSAATGKAGVKQEVLHQPKPAAANTSADAISAMCAKNEGSKATDELIKSLPEKQRETVIAALRGVIAGMARDPAAQETLRRVTLTIDASRTAVICVPIRRTQPPGAPPAFTYTAHRIEPNGRMETLQPGAQPLVYNSFPGLAS